MSKLDTLFSQYIRQKNSQDEFAECFTCGKVQCVACNMFKQGQQYIFGQNLDTKYGDGTAHELYMKSKMILKIPNIELKEMIEKYTLLLKEF